MTRPVRAIEGAGVGLRHAFASELAESAREPDWLEVIVENWTYDASPTEIWLLDRCVERWPATPHSFNLSLGGPAALDRELLAHIRRFCRRTRAPFWSDHISFSSTRAAVLNDLLPLPRTYESVRHVARRIRRAQELVEAPLIVENVCHYVEPPGCLLGEAEFVTAVLEESDCGLLLDITNVLLNAMNFGYDALSFLKQLPSERVRQIHVAGYSRDALGLDTHRGPVGEDVWALYEQYLRHLRRAVPTSVEWDTDIPAWPVVADELDRVRLGTERALGRSLHATEVVS